MAIGLNPDRRRGGQDRDPVIAQDSGDLVRDVLILDHHQARGALDDGHLAAEPAEHLPELEPDVAAAEAPVIASGLGRAPVSMTTTGALIWRVPPSGKAISTVLGPVKWASPSITSSRSCARRLA